MNMENIIMMHYYDKIVLGKYDSKTAEMVTLSDALQITKIDNKHLLRKKHRMEQLGSYDSKIVRWHGDTISIDGNSQYTAVNGKSSWTNKNAKVFTSPNTILSILDFYRMDSLVEYLKK